MKTLVQSFKYSVSQVEAGASTGISTSAGVSASTVPAGGIRAKTAKLTKPAKVPTWTQDLTPETFAKQIQTMSDILEEIPEYVKYQDLMESLKTNKEIKGLPTYVREYVLPTLDKKTDQTMKRVLKILSLK